MNPVLAPEAETPTFLALCEALARHLHRDEVDKQGQPYVGHLLRVEARIHRELHIARGAAWLHDVVEGGHIYGFATLREIGIPEDVVRVVEALTKNTGEPYSTYIRRVSVYPTATLVKLADLEDNLDATRGPIPVGLVARYERARAFLLNAQGVRS